VVLSQGFASPVSRRVSEIVGVALFALSLIWLIALASYDPNDAAWFFATGTNDVPSNFIGPVGAFLPGLPFRGRGVCPVPAPAPRVTPMESMVADPPRSALGRSMFVDASSDAAPTKSWSQRTRSLLGVQIAATGSYVPETIIPNPDLQTRWGRDFHWM